MSSGKIFAMVLEAMGHCQVRDTMGATDPKKRCGHNPA